MVLFAAQNQFATLGCMVALVITICFVLIRTQRNVARSRESMREAPGANEARSRPLHGAGGPEDMLRWEVSMHETARDLSAQLDSKLGLLQHLIREADRAAARLEAALAATDDSSHETLPIDHPVHSPLPADSHPRNQADALRAAGQHSSESKAPQPDPSQPESPGDTRYQEIYLLADYGYPPAEIAARLGNPVGEIELILSLRKKR